MNNCMKLRYVRRITERRKDAVATIKLDVLLNWMYQWQFQMIWLARAVQPFPPI